jgi:hypothetical protein
MYGSTQSIRMKILILSGGHALRYTERTSMVPTESISASSVLPTVTPGYSAIRSRSISRTSSKAAILSLSEITSHPFLHIL